MHEERCSNCLHTAQFAQFCSMCGARPPEVIENNKGSRAQIFLLDASPVREDVAEIFCETGIKEPDIGRVDGPLRRNGESNRGSETCGKFQCPIATMTISKRDDPSAPDFAANGGNDDVHCLTGIPIGDRGDNANCGKALLAEKIVHPEA